MNLLNLKSINLNNLKSQLNLKAIKRHKLIKNLRNHPVTFSVVTFLTLAIIGGGFLAWYFLGEGTSKTAYVVIVSYDGHKETVPSIEPTVGALLNKLDIKTSTGDVVQPSLDTRINQNQFRINIIKAVPVEIVDGSTDTYTFSAAATPRAVAEQTGISLYPEDEASVSLNTSFTTGQAIGKVITIKRSVPLTLILYGMPEATRSHSSTVAQMLKEKNIVLRDGDSVDPSLNTPITPGMQVFILHKGTKIVSSDQVIPAPVQTVEDASLSVGTSAIAQNGQNGTELVTYEVNEQTGAQTPFQSIVLDPAVPEILDKGTAPVTSSLSEWLLTLRTCESGGNYNDDTGNGYYGAYQFSLGTWRRLGYSGLPSDASPSDQDAAIVRNTNLSSGGLATQNPGCYEKTGISAFPPGS